MPWKMFLVEETEFCRLSLRRFTYSSTPGKLCPREKDFGHDAIAIIDPKIVGQSERSMIKGAFEGDPRWPKTCASCPYVFEETDQWQVNYDRLYRGAPEGKLYCLREHPPGAVWRATWLEDIGSHEKWCGPDGKAYVVKLPGDSEWVIYSHSSTGEGKDRKEGPKWDVQGTVPDITVSPSINAVGYFHGFIKNGQISEDCEGRKYDGVPRTA